ncbi:MAG: AMP-binding protein [Actinobacteria bacterium]|nr:AMP-binding protein [Actinomycetota bacterium]
MQITHESAANTCDDVSERFGVTADDRVLAVSALDFDLSVYDLFGLLSVGGAVVLVPESERQDSSQWSALIRRWGVTVWNSVPALLTMLLDGTADDLGGSLRLALVSGDRVDVGLGARLAARMPGCRLVALGGATEASIWSNAFDVVPLDASWRCVPYGYPLHNQRFRVVDQAGRDCPDWVPGELWIGGLGVADGYRGDAERTRDRFVDYAGERWYRTGDVGRYRPGGLLEFLGRLDSQVKIGGHRVELGEVEAALRADHAVSDAVAVTIGEARLGAVVVGANGDPDPETVHARLRDRLPGYMIPDIVAVVADLPLTPNGKVDRRAAVTLLDSAPGSVPEPPRGEVETGVAGTLRCGAVAAGAARCCHCRAASRLDQCQGVRQG